MGHGDIKNFFKVLQSVFNFLFLVIVNQRGVIDSPIGTDDHHLVDTSVRVNTFTVFRIERGFFSRGLVVHVTDKGFPFRTGFLQLFLEQVVTPGKIRRIQL